MSGNSPLHGLDPRDLIREGFSALRGGGGAPWVPPAAEDLARELTRYEVVRLTGRGGMGAVYDARDTKLHRRVALKLLPPEAALDARATGQFLTEERALAALQHPHIVTLYDAGETAGGSLYFVMEFVEGEDLAARMQRGPVPRTEALRIITAAAEALSAAHARGVLHRDLKPSNILLGADGRVRVADFGLASMRYAMDSREGDSSGPGTEHYAAPEQMEGLMPPSPQADVYSLGVVSYELLTGVLPRGDLSGPLRTAGVADRFDAPLLRALAPEPERRTGSAEEFLHAIQAAARAVEEDAATGRRLARTRRVAAGIALLGAAAAVFAVMTIRQSHTVTEQSGIIRGQELSARRTAAMVDFDLGNDAALRTPPDLTAAEFHFARATASDPDNTLAATRLASLRRMHPHAQRTGTAMNHAGSVVAAVFSRDGTRIATASADGTARLWDGHTGAPLSPPLVHGKPLTSVAFSPDNQWLASTDEAGTVHLWKAADGAPGPVLAHGDKVHMADFSPDSMRVATCSEDKTVIVWKVADGSRALPPLVHDGGVMSARFSPDGTQILTASTDSRVRLWGAADGQLRHRTPQGSTFIMAAVWNHAGDRIGITTTGGNSAVLPVLPPEAPLESNWPPLLDYVGGLASEPAYSADFLTPCFCPDGILAAMPTPQPEWVCVRYLAQGLWSPLQPRHHGRITAAAFSADSLHFATAGRDHEVKVWDVHTGNMVLMPLPHEGEVNAVAFHPDNRTVLTATARGVAQLWSPGPPAPAPAQLLDLTYNISEVWDAAVSHDGRLIVTAGNDRCVRFWNAETLAPAAEPWNTGHHAMSCDFSADDRRMVVTNHSTTAMVWDVAAHRVLQELPHLGYKPHRARFSPDGHRVVTAVKDGACVVWTLSDVAHPLIIRPDTEVHDVLWSADGRSVIAACGDGYAHWYDAATGTAQPLTVRHDRAVLSLDLSSDGRLLLTGSADHTVRLWDAVTCQPHGDPMLHPGQVPCARFSRDGTRIAAICETGEVRVWDVAQSRLLLEPMAGGREGLSTTFNADGRRLITCMKHPAAFVWNLDALEK